MPECEWGAQHSAAGYSWAVLGQLPPPPVQHGSRQLPHLPGPDDCVQLPQPDIHNYQCLGGAEETKSALLLPCCPLFVHVHLPDHRFCLLVPPGGECVVRPEQGECV